MAVVTTDILIEGIRRDAVFEWLAQPVNHERIVEDAFDGFTHLDDGAFELELKAGSRTRTMLYRFDRTDNSHGGRRVYVKTSGKRFRGQLSYSLRTMKPSTNTLVTMHMDFDPGSVLGPVVLAMGLEAALHASFKRALDNLARALPRG